MKATQNTRTPRGQATSAVLHTVNFLITVLLGILTGAGRLTGGTYPLAAALCAAMPARLVIPAAVGSVIGTLTAVPFGKVAGYLAAILFSSFLRLVTQRLLRGQYGLVTAAACAFGGIVTGGLVRSMLAAPDLAGWILLICVGVLAGGFAAVFALAQQTLRAGLTVCPIGEQQRVALLASVSVVLAAGSGYTVLDLSPARVLAVLMILCVARYAGTFAGVTAGAAAGAAMTLMGGTPVAWIAGAYALGGLLAGLFARFGAAVCTAMLTVGNGLFVLVSAGGDAAIASLIEVAAATVLFLLLPRRVREKLSLLLTPRSEPARLSGLRHSLVRRLRFASLTLGDVSSVVEQVSDKLEHIDRRELWQVFARCEHTVCNACALRIYCMTAAKNSTRAAFQAAAVALRQSPAPAQGVLPAAFTQRCVKAQEVEQCLREGMAEYTAYEAAARRAKEIRGAVSDQLGAVALLLDAMAQDFDKAEQYDREAEAQVRAVLRREGIVATDVGCPVACTGRMTVEIIAKEIPGGILSRSRLTRALSQALMREFEMPSVSQAGDETLIRLCQRAPFRLETGMAQRAAQKNALCGDASTVFSDGQGHQLLLLSDGMGSGARAAVDSAMVSGLMTRLLTGGFGYDCALGIVNCALLFKSEDESLATVDLTAFDCYSGSCEFYKAGAPVTLIRKDARIARADCGSFPAGILRQVSFDRSQCELDEGDIVVMVSDGLTFDGDQWLADCLREFQGGSMQQLAEALLQQAAERRTDGHTDDMTVITATVHRA